MTCGISYLNIKIFLLNSYNYKYKIKFILKFNLILNIHMEQKEYLPNNQNDPDKILLNTFNFILLVKLYTASQKQETFNYTTIKGGLFLFKDKNTIGFLFGSA